MSKILFFTFFGYRSFILDIKNEFEKNNFTVENYSYSESKNQDKNLAEITDDVVQLVTKSYESDTNNTVSTIDYIFMFLLPDDENFMANLKDRIDGSRTKIVFYNFDDPMSQSSDLIKYSKNIDCFITPLKSTMCKLKIILDIDVDRIHNIPMYSIMKNTEKNINNTYKSDISILCSDYAKNTYDTKNIIQTLKKMSVENDYDLKLYGPDTLEVSYPDVFEDRYNDNIETIIDNSKVVLFLNDELHMDNKINEHIVQIMGRGTLLMIPYSKKIKHLIEDNHNCVVFNKIDYVEKIKHMLENHHEYEIMKINSRKCAEKKFSLEKWTKDVINLISNYHKLPDKYPAH